MPVALKQSPPLCDHSPPIQQEPTQPPVVHSTWVLAIHHWPSSFCFLIIIVEDSCLCLCLSYFHFSVIWGIGVNMDSRPTSVVSASYRHSRRSIPSTLGIFRLLSSYWSIISFRNQRGSDGRGESLETWLKYCSTPLFSPSCFLALITVCN